MENHSSIERVVGNISESEKEHILKKHSEIFDEQLFAELVGHEKEKTPEELSIISLVNDVTNKIRRKHGLDDFDIPPKNIHVIASESWQNDEANGVFLLKEQAVAIEERSSMLMFAEMAFHEMLHFKCYGALQVVFDEDGPEISDYRSGLTVNPRDGGPRRLNNINEAVVVEITKKYFPQLVDNAVFTEEIEQTKDVLDQVYRNQTKTGRPADIFSDRNDIYYAVFSDPQNPEKGFGTVSFYYRQEREILHTLIDKLFERNPDIFQSKEEVFEVFEKGMVTGNILPLGRLIETTFGHGALRCIGELDDDIEAQQEFVESL